MRSTPALLASMSFTALMAIGASAGPTEPASAAVSPATPDSGFMLGASVGALAPVVFSPQLFDGVGLGPSVSVDAGYRFARYFYLGAVYQHGFLSSGGWHGGGTTSASADYGGINFVTISNPDARVALLTEVGVGYRVLTLGQGGVDGPSPGTLTESAFETTFLGIGLEMNLGDRVRLVPELTLAGGGTAAFGFLGLTAYFDFAGT